jgi:outer membrane lipoprotein-sorting protein
VKSILILAAVAWCGQAESLDAIFARMDEAAKKFKSASAALHQTQYTAVISETSQEDGQLRVKRSKGSIKLRVDFKPPNERIAALDGNRGLIFYPKSNVVNKYDVSKYASASTVDQLLLLSFGAASGAELKKGYTVTSGGTETVDGKSTTRVELVPKSEEMRKVIGRISLWIPEGQYTAVKERLDEAGKDYIEWTYPHVAVNGPVSDSEVTFKIPANARVVGDR